MKNKHHSRLLTRSLMLVAMLIPYFAMAQDPGPCPDCPIDGGLTLLLAAGLIYGVKKYREPKKDHYEE